VYVAFGVPPVMLGITENSNRATALEEEKKFYESEIEPIQSELESLFTRMLNVDFGIEGIEFKFAIQDFRDREALNKIAEDGMKS
jgi:phage portal protein BeeE